MRCPTALLLLTATSSSAALLPTSSSLAAAQLRHDWRSAFATQPLEFSRLSLRVDGVLPEELRGGTFFKNAPARFERGGIEYAHWLDGDGYVTSLALDDGMATWSARYVRTDAFDNEDASDAVEWRTTFGTQKPGGVLANAMDIKLKSPANTNVMLFGDKLYALWEAGPPYALDPHTLECQGASDLGGRLRLSSSHGALPGTVGVAAVDRLLEAAGLLTDACSAHPREDARDRQNTVAWSWRQRLVGEPAIEVALHNLPMAHASDDDEATAAPAEPVTSTLHGVAFAPHDMALSRARALFVASPTRVDILPFILGIRGPAQCSVFDKAATLPAGSTSYIHVVPRTDGNGQLDGAGGHREALAVAIGQPFHPVHSCNAWDDESDGSRVQLLVSCWPPAAVRRLAFVGSSLLGSWEELRDGDFSGVPMTNLVRFEIDTRSERVISHAILADGAQLDHPKVHPRVHTRESRFVFATLGRHDNGGDEDATPRPPQSFGCVDLAAAGGSGELVDAWHAGPRRLVDEATLVAMAPADASEDVDERAVWLIAPIFDGETRTTSYVVLDGRRLSDGPVCELHLPEGTFVPWGLHGCWQEPASS